MTRIDYNICGYIFRFYWHSGFIGLRFFCSDYIAQRDFFEDHIGPCSFDFIKVSQDQLKLFVAVRFETRDAAKECMHKYKDGEILGYPIEMTWFRDIRRFVSYQQSQSLRPPSMRGRGFARGRSRVVYDRRVDYRDDESKRKRTLSDERRSLSRDSRSRSNSSSSRSRSPRHSRDRSRTVDSNHSQHTNIRAHSRSRSRLSSASPPPHEKTSSPPKRSPTSKHNGEGNGRVPTSQRSMTPPLPPSPVPASTVTAAVSITKSQPDSSRKASVSRSPSPVIERKSRKSKREKKKRRRRSPSSSSSSTTVPERTSDELSEGELRRKILKKREKAMKEESSKYSDEHFHDSKDVHECSAFPPFFSASQKMTEKSGVWEEKEVVAPRIESILQNTTLKFGLESTEDIPKRVIRDTPPQTHSKKQRLTSPAVPRNSKGNVDDLLSKRGIGLKPANNVLGDLKSTQMTFAQQGHHVSMKTMVDEDPDPVSSPVGGLRLSSFARQLNAGNERERKLSKLSPELFAKFTTKKKQLESAYKSDCETFAFVTKALIEKDQALEDRLLAALSAALNDIEESFNQKIDQYLDQLLMFMTV